jgi:hypothetical protein
MQLCTLPLLLSMMLVCSGCTAQRSLSGYAQAQFNKTLYDRTAGNNPWGAGLGFQVLLKGQSKLAPFVDLTADAYFEDDKVLRLNEDGSAPEDLGSVINLFVGTSYEATKKFYLSLAAGPSIAGGEVRFGIKPSVGLFLSENRKWTGRLSYVNVFNRDKISKEDFGTASLSLAVRLF